LPLYFADCADFPCFGFGRYLATEGRALNDEIIIFDSTGVALQDVAVAAFVYEKAAQAGFERTVEFAL
jgi:ornithine cyclodeaminase/alanine dehydrogenase-like protein (mu-crystallin family)